MIYGNLPDSFWQGMQTLVAEDARARKTPRTARAPATAAAPGLVRRADRPVPPLLLT
jgi:hypothetical protein